jgi:sugar lactone lactonase YvrE
VERVAELSGKPRIERVEPAAAIAGGEVLIQGQGFASGSNGKPRVKFGEAPAGVVVASDDFVVATVPDNGTGSSVEVTTEAGESSARVEIGALIADNLHPVANPAVDAEGYIYVTFSGRRGQKVPIALYRISPSFEVKPLLGDLLNATGLALDSSGTLYVSSRAEGVVYQVTRDSRRTSYAEGMGIATGLAFDADDNLLVGDRSGTIFKIGRDRQIFVFATLEPSVAAYHLAFGPDQQLYVTGPTTSSHDCVYRISSTGQVSVFYRGLGRPQGLAFDAEGNLYVAASLRGRRGIVRFTPSGQPELAISGPNLVGLAFAPPKPGGIILASNSGLYHLAWPIAGLLPRR